MTEAPSLAVCVITLNEEKSLPRCLASVRGLPAEIVVVDSCSTDRTRQIAAAVGAIVVIQPFLGHVRQKQLALDRATTEWVLSLDADEWLDDELREAIATVLQSPPPGVAGFAMNRRPFYLGRWIRGSGWFPDWKLRLVRRELAHWTGQDPHDRLEVTGKVVRLRPGTLRHYSFVDLADHVARLNAYAGLAAAGRRPVSTPRALVRMTVKPMLVFLQKMTVGGGFRDGVRGVIIAAMTAFYVFLREARLWERTHANGEPSDS
jgi:glycosyltransferase involved in cell wall biosynthesis